MTSKSTKSVPPSEDTEAFVSIPPDGGWGWLVVIAAFYIFFVSDGVLISLGVFLQEIARSLKCTPSEVSIAGAIQTCCYCFAGKLKLGTNSFYIDEIDFFRTVFRSFSQ